MKSLSAARISVLAMNVISCFLLITLGLEKWIYRDFLNLCLLNMAGHRDDEYAAWRQKTMFEEDTDRSVVKCGECLGH